MTTRVTSHDDVIMSRLTALVWFPTTPLLTMAFTHFTVHYFRLYHESHCAWLREWGIYGWYRWGVTMCVTSRDIHSAKTSLSQWYTHARYLLDITWLQESVFIHCWLCLCACTGYTRKLRKGWRSVVALFAIYRSFLVKFEFCTQVFLCVF